MKFERNADLTGNARALRRNMTWEERRLWYSFLRGCPGHFRRQQIMGNYIVDFYSDAFRLVIEVDGSQHYQAEGQRQDRQRDEALCRLGMTVLRYSNADIRERFPAVCEDIQRRCGMK